MSYTGPSTYGLVTANAVAAANGVNPYAPTPYLSDSQWWGNSAEAPAQTQWTAPSYQNFTYQKYDGTDPTYQAYNVAAPTYQGLADGDYNRLENALAEPGQQAATQAYNNAKRDLTDAYSANGMYGSSQFTRQMNDQVNTDYMNSLATNAANATSQRYNLENQDQQFAQSQNMAAWQAGMQQNNAANQMNYNVWNARLGENQQMNSLDYQNNAASNAYDWQASTAQRDWDNSQANQQVNYNNMLAQSKQNFEQQGLQWNAQQDQNAWKNAYGEFGNYDPQLEQYNKEVMKSQATAAENQNSGGILGGIGSVLGGIGSASNGIGGLIKSAGSIGSLVSSFAAA